MSGFSVEQLKFDPTATEDTHNVGAYLRSSDGTLITHTADASKRRIDVSSGAEHYEAAAFTGGEKGAFMLAVNDSGNFAPLRVTDAGELKVDVQVTTGADKVEDTAHADGATGAYMLSVRQDTLAGSTSASGDYQSFKTDALGALWTNQYKTAPASGHNAATEAATTVNDTATPVPATALTNRTKIVLQNRSNNVPVTIGFSNAVTFGSGPILSPGSSVELEIAAGVTLHAIADTGKTASIAHFELAYNP